MSLVECPECGKEISEKANVCPYCNAQIDPRLVQAAEIGDLQTVRNLLDNGSAINAVDWEGYTALMKASVGGHLKIVKLLLDKGADINAVDSEDCTALIRASEGGHLKTVKLLLKRGADPHAKSPSGITALSRAVFHSSYEVAQFLLESVDGWQDDDLMGVFEQAIIWDWLDIVSVLVEHFGVDCSLAVNWGPTPLIAAARYNRPNTVRFLLDNGADVDARDVFYKWTALNHAAEHGHTEMVKLLLERGAEPNAEGNYTALQRATIRGHIEIVRLLLEYGALVNYRVDYVGDKGCTALAMACSPVDAQIDPQGHDGRLEIAKLLLRHGADVNARDAEGQTPLIGIVSRGISRPDFTRRLLDSIKLLLANGADVNAQCNLGRTALMHGCFMHRCFGEQLEVVKLLLENGANPNLKGESGTAIGWAHENAEILGLLKQYGAKTSWWPF